MSNDEEDFSQNYIDDGALSGHHSFQTEVTFGNIDPEVLALLVGRPLTPTPDRHGFTIDIPIDNPGNWGVGPYNAGAAVNEQREEAIDRMVDMTAGRHPTLNEMIDGRGGGPQEVLSIPPIQARRGGITYGAGTGNTESTLVASGGWCAPITTAYDTGFSTEGLETVNHLSTYDEDGYREIVDKAPITLRWSNGDQTNLHDHTQSIHYGERTELERRLMVERLMQIVTDINDSLEG